MNCWLKYAGTMRQFVLDDKGCVMIGAFGLPGYHHEDNDGRAISSAKFLQKALKELGTPDRPITSKVGIARGNVFSGLIGAVGSRCEFAMMGSSVNLAARLMGKAETDGILVDQEVFSHTKHLFHFEEGGEIKAKGYDDMVAVHAVCEEEVFWTTMEDLKSRGATSILVVPIEKMLD